jgi:hypothetical protein
MQAKCTCNPGYSGTGKACAPISCGPLTITNGTVVTNGATFGQTATYTCDAGYTKTGGTTRTCEVAGWSGTAPTCAPFDCRTPANPSHGRVTVTNGTLYPSGSVRYICDNGYSLSGSNTDTRTCTATGWSGSTPTCIGCGDGIISASLFEQCEIGGSTTAWDCINCKTTGAAYDRCPTSGICAGGLACHSGGYCTVGPCSNDAQCPPTPPTSPVKSSCQGGGFACTLYGCTATSQCPPGLTCSTAEGFCVGI